MCGIWGIIPRSKMGLFEADADVAKQMMLDTARRGEHSTGLFITNYHNPTEAPTGVKVLGGPHNIVWCQPLWKEIRAFVQKQAGSIVGHGRQATKGKISADNAHPFVHDHITLVHNGTLYGGVSYAKKGEIDVEVDSHALAIAMAEKGVAKALSEISGAYAVIVHDAKQGKLYFARNKDRPLALYTAHDRHYLMSEWTYLNALIWSLNKQVDGEKIKILQEEALFYVDLADPREIRMECSIKLLREEFEEKRRAIWDAEDKERKKQQASRHAEYSKRKAEKLSLKKESKGKDVAFTVNGYKQYGTNIRYNARTLTGDDVFFITDSVKPNYMMRQGKAKIDSTVVTQGEVSYFVKHRQIQWLDELEKAETSKQIPLTAANDEDDDQGAYFMTNNMKKMLYKDFNERIKDEGCDYCAKTFISTDDRKVCLTDDNKLLCFSCYADAMFDKASDEDRVPTIN